MEKLLDNGDLLYNWSEDGGAIIRKCTHDVLAYDLYEVPQYGGEERYHSCHPSIEKAKALADRWT